jgi:hypothetical protein
LVVQSDVLPTAEEAMIVGHRAQIAVMIAATRERLGVDFGKEGPTGLWMEEGLRMLGVQQGLPEATRLLNDTLGVTAVDATADVRFVSAPTAQAIIGTPVDRFAEAFVQGFELAPSVSDRAGLALELFSVSRFEASLRARFLTLVSAVECITDRIERDDDALELVRSLRQQLESSQINETDQRQLVGALGDLERRSITSSCKALVAAYCGPEKAQLFGQCYRARSELVHVGQTEFDIGTHLHGLETLVAETIVGAIAHVA